MATGSGRERRDLQPSGLQKKYADNYEFLTQSDCEVILALYRDKGVDFLEDMNGILLSPCTI